VTVLRTLTGNTERLPEVIAEANVMSVMPAAADLLESHTPICYIIVANRKCRVYSSDYLRQHLEAKLGERHHEASCQGGDKE